MFKNYKLFVITIIYGHCDLSTSKYKYKNERVNFISIESRFITGVYMANFLSCLCHINIILYLIKIFELYHKLRSLK